MNEGNEWDNNVEADTWEGGADGVNRYDMEQASGEMKTDKPQGLHHKAHVLRRNKGA